MPRAARIGMSGAVHHVMAGASANAAETEVQSSTINKMTEQYRCIAERSDMLDYPSPRDPYEGESKNFPWIFKIHEDFHFKSRHIGKEFDSHWLRLEPNGMVTVKANETGYAWDGCTPKWSLLGLIIVGTPDGHVDIRTEKPLTYHASLVHDAFYQYLEHVPVSKKDIDKQFYEMLREADFPLAWIYYLFASLFGGRGVKQRNV